MAADVTPFATLIPPFARAGWEALVILMVTALAEFWVLLPHLVQLGGGIIVLLTIWEKLTALGVVARVRACFNRKDDDATG